MITKLSILNRVFFIVCVQPTMYVEGPGIYNIKHLGGANMCIKASISFILLVFILVNASVFSIEIINSDELLSLLLKNRINSCHELDVTFILSVII